MRDRYLNLREAAALSGMSPRLVLELCRAGIIRARDVRYGWQEDR